MIWEYIIFFIAMGLIGLVAWVGYLEHRFRPIRYVILGLIGLIGVSFFGFGSLLQWALSQPEFLKQLGLDASASTAPGVPPMDLSVFATAFSCVGAMSLISLFPLLRRLLAKSIFPGFQPDHVVHIWSLFMAGCAAIALTTILALYDPKLFVQNLTVIDLYWSVFFNLIAFVMFVVLASGVGILYPVQAFWSNFTHMLKLSPLTIKDWGLCIGFALGLAAIVTGLNGVLLQYTDPEALKTIEAMGDTMAPTDNPMQVVLSGIVIGGCAGVGEELLFRGLMQPVFGLVPTSILFVLTHSQYGFTPIQLALLLVSLAFGLIRIRYNTTAAMVTHSFYDFFILLSGFVVK